jgi:hypothetical protein
MSLRPHLLSDDLNARFHVLATAKWTRGAYYTGSCTVAGRTLTDSSATFKPDVLGLTLCVRGIGYAKVTAVANAGDSITLDTDLSVATATAYSAGMWEATAKAAFDRMKFDILRGVDITVENRQYKVKGLQDLTGDAITDLIAAIAATDTTFAQAHEDFTMYRICKDCSYQGGPDWTARAAEHFADYLCSLQVAVSSYYRAIGQADTTKDYNEPTALEGIHVERR